MPPVPHISDESVISRWMSLELARINTGIVSHRKTLGTLLAESEPAACTRGETPHLFDRNVLRLLGSRLPGPLTRDLRLPILFFLDTRVPDSCYLAEETALEALKVLGELSTMRRFDAGKAWVSRMIVYSLIRKYPTVIQIAVQ
ncbi:MAG: DUF61 family protein [Methanoregulaceae archaeon]|nr:DUF61 family protein [Methanoregulaceae archaeon]